jgi:hypothetical protein
VKGAQLPDTGPASHEDSGRTASADEVRSALANFQSGVTRARHWDDVPASAAPVAEPAAAPAAPAPSEPEPARRAATTANGLRKRVRGAQLPDTGPALSAQDAGRAASADEIRSALSSFQHGVRRATDAVALDADD